MGQPILSKIKHFLPSEIYRRSKSGCRQQIALVSSIDFHSRSYCQVSSRVDDNRSRLDTRHRRFPGSIARTYKDLWLVSI